MTPGRASEGRGHSLAGARYVPAPILLGEYDRQGTHRNAAANAEALRAALDAGHHKNYTIKVMFDSDDLLAELRNGNPSTSLPPANVWKTVAEWSGKQLKSIDPAAGTDEAEAGPGKPIRLYPKSVYGPFPFRPDTGWRPPSAGQQRPYGFWYR